MPGPRVRALADRLREVQHEFVTALEAADEDRLCAGPIEGDWNGANVVGHVTELQPFWAKRAKSLSSRYPAPLTRTIEEHEARNRAVEAAGRRTKTQLLASLRRANAATLALIASMDEPDLDASGPRWDGSIISAETVIKNFIIDHVVEHAAQLRDRIGFAAA